MGEDVTVRQATEEDIPALVELSQAVTSEGLEWLRDQPASESGFRELFAAVSARPNSISLVADFQGQVVGELECVARGPNHSEFVIFVHYDHRRRGVASALLQALLRWAESQSDLGRLQAKVLEPNVASKRLLERFGFSELAREPHLSTIRGVEMREYLYHRDFRSE